MVKMIGNKTTYSEKIGIALIYILLTAFSMTIIYPFLNIIARAFSGYVANTTGNVFFWPVDFQIHSMKTVLMNSQFGKSFFVSSSVTVMGTILTIFVSGLGAYALSRKRLVARRFLTACFVFTMMFSGGMVPTYIVVRLLGMLNTLWALFVPGAVSVYNMLILKSAFEGVPVSLEESAKIDGASNFVIFCRIALPVIKPTLAAVSLFLLVGFWNEYWSAILYITKNDYKPIQLYLLDIISYTADPLNSGIDVSLDLTDSPQGIRAATIIASTFPILAVYPFLQKYFVKGVLLGSIKE